MRRLIARHHHTIGEFVKFVLVGLLNTGIDVVIFFVLTRAGALYLAAQVFGYSCGAANSYLLNKLWTFRSCGLSYWEMVRFTVVNLASLAISLAALYFFHDTLQMGLAAAKGGATLLALAANFLGNKLWVFR